MSKRNRIFLGILLIYALGVALLLYRVMTDLDPRYRESAEELLVDTANLLASLIETDIRDGVFHPARMRPAFQDMYARRFAARIYAVTKTQADLRVYVTDRNGVVVFDSLGRDDGKDFWAWRDVRLTLQGEYGARTTPEAEGDPRSTVMYVGAPIRWKGEITGMVSVGKPMRGFGGFIASARQKLLLVGLTSSVSVLLLAVLVSVWLVRPFSLIAEYIRYVRDQKQVSLPRLSRRALGILGAAFDEMRDALAGRSYAEEYIQTLTHEIKSPLSAIRGAAELLQESMPQDRRERFLKNIRDETQRIQDLVDRLLELSGIEKQRGLTEIQPVRLDELLPEATASLAPVADARGVRILAHGAEGCVLGGERFLLLRALINLLQNAIDFSPGGGEIEVVVTCTPRQCQISIRDHGPGVPDYALDRVFEKFYSLRRPNSGKKGTGLGLSFVKEIAELHRGGVELRNHPDGGAVATLTLPRHVSTAG
ncbi:MAG TPA: two-component system sensor histidine kinase CreC [Candidatus Methylomirabilis sp.]|nr:two-component system sensor histidine kinase CreC [Candidatus Methylomirabilis sp.]